MDETGVEPKPIPPKRGPVVLRPLEWVFGPWTRENAMVWLKLVLVVLAIKWLFLDSYRVPTGSMEPTLHGTMSFTHDDRVLVNKLAYGVRLPMTSQLLFPTSAPKRWDVVVFRSAEPPAQHTGPIGRLIHRLWPTNLVKRVVGLPGERIHIQDGVVYADGKPLTPPKDMPPVRYTSMAPEETGIFMVDTDENGKVVMKTRSNLMRYGIWEEDEYAIVPEGQYLMLGDNSGDSVDGRFFGWVSRDQLLGRAYAIWWPFNRTRDLTGFTQTWWGLALLIGIPVAVAAVEWLTIFIMRSWRVRKDSPELGLKQGDRLRVNCLALGLRLPFSRRRLTRGVELLPGDVVVYRAPRNCEWADVALLGVLREGDERFFIEPAEGPDYPDSRHFGPVGRNEIVGRADSVWWPLGRRRALGPNGGMVKEGNAKASYGKENE